MTILNKIKQLEALDEMQVATSSMKAVKDDLRLANLQQMLEGKNKLGEDITPSYLDDPFFKSKESAQRYSDWKDKITPNPKRKKGTPNLFITGAFHESITVDVDGEMIKWQASFKEAEITSKFKNLFGLGGDIKRDFLNDKLRPQFIKNMRKATGMK